MVEGDGLAFIIKLRVTKGQVTFMTKKKENIVCNQYDSGDRKRANAI